MTEPSSPAPGDDIGGAVGGAGGGVRGAPDPLEERVVASELVHRGRYMEFRVQTVERADGSRGTRDVVLHPGAVAVLALDDDGRLLMVRQWRIPAGQALLEIPAGTLDVHDGVTEDPDGAARRELEEETGHRARAWQRLASFWTAPGFASELMHLYLATGIEGVSGDDRLAPDEDEHLELRHVALGEAVAMVERGEIRDAKSILGILWLDRSRRAVADPATATQVTAAPAPVPGPPAAASDAPPPAPDADPDAIRIGYGFNPLAFGFAYATFLRRQRSALVLGWLSVAMTCLNLVTFQDAGLALLTGFLGVTFLTGWIAVPTTWWSYRNRAAILGHQEVTITEAGLTSNWPAGGGTITWRGIEKIDHASGWLFVRTAAGSAWPIPESAFTAAQLQAFRLRALGHGLALDGTRVDPPPR